MKGIRLIIGIIITAIVLSGVTWDRSRGTLTSLQADAQLYKPPIRKSAASRIGGGTRGPGDKLPSLSVLAPNHTGLTVREQPELYWYISKASTSPVEITLSDTEAIDPLLEVVIEPPISAGIHRIRLADHDVRLKPGVPYEWFVTLLADSEDPSQEVVSGSAIERVVLSGARKQEVEMALKKAAPKAGAWRVYASSGIWYDALAALSALIEKAPKDKALRQQRATLLDDISLPEVAMYARKP